MDAFQLPEDFLFGTATASLQIEGGDKNNNWYRFCEQGKTKDGTHCIVAADHWNRYEEDIQIMKDLHQDTYRLSVEWARIEPERGKFNKDALTHYRKIIQMLIDNGIQPLVTIHHFSNPIWFEDMGGWAKKESVDCFVNFTEKVVLSLGDLVSEWVTINEPNVYLEGTYSTGEFPPNKANFIHYFKGAKHMILAHIKAYKLIHKIRDENNFIGTTKVGIAHHLRVFEAKEHRTLAKIPTTLMTHVFHTIFLEGMTYGKLVFPLGLGNYPLGKGTFCDFMGINYYSRDIVKFSLNPFRMFGQLTVKVNTAVNDMGWEIYPHGLYRVCRNNWDQYEIPIYITENGICDEKDEQRTEYIYSHLLQVNRLIKEGVQVKRYYYWSLLDNFEWEFGLSERFGIVHVDYDSLKRTVRASGKFYGEISKNGGVTEAMIDM